jgi:hypothetical protein
MKNRVHDAPVKIIQILPVDNNSSNQPLKPSDFSFFKKLVDALRQTVVRATAAPQPKEVGQEHSPTDQTAIVASSEEVRSGPMYEQSEVPVQRSDTLSGMPPGPEWPDRAPGIVVRDIVAIQHQPSPVDVTPPEPIEMDPVEMDPATPSPGVRQRLEAAKAMIAGRWCREKEQIALFRAAVLAKVYPAAETVWQSLVTAPGAYLRKWGTAPRGIMRRTRHLERRVRKITTQASVLEAKNDDKKEDTENAARELTHELEVTKSTLLAQQQALENVTVQLNAVQKELGRHKHMLAGLMTQVEAVDLKIVRTLHPPASRKSKSSADPSQPRRASTKKSGLTVERSREQRV